MPRKGAPKVRTGCLTCKKRKVKCDETRPSCNRCTSTGRTCDGYMPPPPGWMSWDRLLSGSAIPWSPNALPDADDAELRSLAFYHQIVAPSLCGPLDSSFWTRLVAQMVHAEPATRHAVLAISLLYEDFGHDPSSPGAQSDVAIRHYNAAISHLVGPQTSCPADLNTVLLVCILFTCIEFLRGDAESAISHSQHGISLLNSGTQVKPELARVFRHLSIFPYFFGGQVSSFPVLNDTLDLVAFSTPDQALESLDRLLARAVRLVRASDHHRLGIGQAAQPLETVVDEQRALQQDLDSWRAAFDRLQTPVDLQLTHHVLETRWLVCKIWAATCLSPSETIYDEHVDDFTRIVDIARLVQTHAAWVHHKFMFVMGFCPLLYFVVAKCRILKLRRAALSLLRELSCVREALWDADTLYAIGERIVEIEHRLDPELVPDEARVRDSAMEMEGQGEGSRLCFLVLGDEGIEKMYDSIGLDG